jgi:hypothetical protein
MGPLLLAVGTCPWGRLRVNYFINEYFALAVYYYNSSKKSAGSIAANTVYSSDHKVTDASGNECGGMRVV